MFVILYFFARLIRQQLVLHLPVAQVVPVAQLVRKQAIAVVVVVDLPGDAQSKPHPTWLHFIRTRPQAWKLLSRSSVMVRLG